MTKLKHFHIFKYDIFLSAQYTNIQSLFIIDRYIIENMKNVIIIYWLKVSVILYLPTPP